MYRKFEIFNHIYILKSFVLDRNVTGIRSTTKDDMHVLFIDCDEISEKWVMARAKMMVERFKLSNVYILKTADKNYHMICLDKLTFSEALHIQAWFDLVALKHYMIFGIRRGYWVLRTSKKFNRDVPRYYDTIVSNYHSREQSSAHACVLKDYFGIPGVDVTNPDNSDVIIREKYPTVI